jgi:hypothetical protein
MSVPNSNSTASLANWCATTESEQLWNIWSATNAGGGGDSDVAVGVDGVTRVPLNVNAAGELKVNVEASIDADLADIENALATTNGILTTTAADTAIIKDETIAIDAKLPALSNGRVPVDANSVPSTTFTYTNTGAIAPATVVIGPIDCSQFKVAAIQCTAYASGSFSAELSNDNITYTAALVGQVANPSNQANNASIGGLGLYHTNTLGFKFFRIRTAGGVASGTTGFSVSLSQSSLPYSVAVMGTVVAQSSILPSVNFGYALYHTLVSAAGTNATSVKAGQASIGTIILSNTSLSTKFVKFFNKASAPTVGTDTPVLQFAVSAGQTLDVSTSFAGLRLSTGFAYAITGGSALLDTTAVAAGDVLVNITYV